MKKNILLALLIVFTLNPGWAQYQNPHPPTDAEKRLESINQFEQLKERSIAGHIPFESVGPTIFSGRVTDLAVNPDDPTEFYVAYASGGLWHTENNGMSFTPLFDDQAVMTIGDIAVDWEHEIIWVGSGENNSSRSSYAGVGMFVSRNLGKTWTHKGLPESHHIGRIVLHPSDTNTLWVASLGHLYSPNEERGVYKTTDGGNTWTKTLFVNENAGAIDLIMDPVDPQTLYAATWERTRRAWNFIESGEGSGIYKSTDGGESWKKVSKRRSGFPTGEGTGRIGLSAVQTDEGTVLFALLDNYNRREKEDEEEQLTYEKKDFKKMTREEFSDIDTIRLDEYLRENDFPEKYTATKVYNLVMDGEIEPKALADYLEDANSLLFDTEVKGAEVYKSTDGGENWEKTHEDYLDGVYYSYGYYFGQIRVAPKDKDHLYIMGVPILKSTDGGKTFESINEENVHVDHHALWVNPDRPGHLILGNDGGVNISYDDGATWIKCNSPAVGQFYTVNVDMAQPYNIYGGTQDNGVWVGPHNYEYNRQWEGTGDYPYDRVLGGDGMQVEIDTRTNNTFYTGFQFGHYYRIDRESGKRTKITPKHDLGQRPYRWNWQSPIHLSHHNQDILYMGANKLFRSMNQGEDFEAISQDLTKGGRKGDVANGTLTTIHESPLRFGLIYTGSDDGMIYVSRDGGFSWQRLDESLPQHLWVSRIQASQHKESRVYLSLNGYRWDDFTPYVYVSDDYGANWQQIGKDLPIEPVNVIREDPVNPDMLYVGTDHSTYVSLDRGKSFMVIGDSIPRAPVHDLVIHPRDKDLVIGTHGRSFYVGHVGHLQQLDSVKRTEPLVVFNTELPNWRDNWGNKHYDWMEPKEPEIHWPVYINSPGEISLSIRQHEGEEVLYSRKENLENGLHYIAYDFTISEECANEWRTKLKNQDDAKKEILRLKVRDIGKYYLLPGKYILTVEKEGNKKEIEFELKEKT